MTVRTVAIIALLCLALGGLTRGAMIVGDRVVIVVSIDRMVIIEALVCVLIQLGWSIYCLARAQR